MAICNENFLKYSALLLCLVNIVLGTFLILAGFSVTSNLSEFNAFIIPAQYFEAPYSSFIDGLCFYLVSIVGICGIAKEEGYILLLHSGMLGYLMLMGGLIIDTVHHANIIIRQDLQNSMYLTLQRYTENSDVGKNIFYGWTMLQQHLRCCGVMNYTDWIESANRKPFWNITHPIPLSCCSKEVAECYDAYIREDKSVAGYVFAEGCLSKSLQHIHLDKINQPLVPLECIGTVGVIVSLLLAWKWRTNIN